MKFLFRLLASLTMVLAAGSWGADEHIVKKAEVRPGKDGSALIVLLHGYTFEGNDLAKVEATLRKVRGLEGADVIRPDLPFDRFSMAGASRVTAELLQAVDRAWDARAGDGKPYQRIVMVGHSTGALYARKLYAAACGENGEAPFEDDLKAGLDALRADPIERARPWAGAVDRIVLLAGMNRGWSISHHMSITRGITTQVGVAIGHVLSWIHGRPPFIFSLRRGSPFITQLRLQWLAMREHASKPDGKPDKTVGNAVTVQLLGTVDDLVSPDDNIDLVSGRDFVYREVEQTGHANVIEMDGSNAGVKRQEALLDAFKAVGAKRVPERSKVTDVIFVIHGIRDEGFWTSRIADRAKNVGTKRGLQIATETSTYGYFPMLSFLRPGARQEKVEWLMDRYTEARAKYPEARFHYIGHSNGTYLLAKALEEYRAVRFDQVVFAGSVVHRGYNWQEFIPHRIKSVANFVATADWVVAWFPNALQILGVQDLGSAGHDGFDLARTNEAIHELKKTYVVGGHGAAIQEAMWNSIAEYAITGTFDPPPARLLSPDQAWWVAWPAKGAPLIWVLIAALLGWGLYGLLKLRLREWAKTVLVLLYCGAVWTVLTEI